MCGIAGLWSVGLPAPREIVTSMTAALQHRGPDSHGIWTSADGSLALGHARLAIVDLSEQGRQPMTSGSGRYTMVFNGEIYNHQHLRHQLESNCAIQWHGHSDTETLIEAIERWGLAAALTHCVGMFAIALWDRDLGTLSLARDRMGEKPLYYTAGPGGVGFASELKALRRWQELDLSLDREALSGYLRYGFIASPRSAFAAVRKLPPASHIVFRAPDRDARPERYWSMPRPLPDTGPNAIDPLLDRERLDELDALLRRSVSDQMLADVPLGAFLSGGIDSSLIVALMQQQSTQRVRTFSMGFGGGDELSVARQTAKQLGTDHTELVVDPSDALAIIPRLTEIYDEPFADSSQIPTVLLSQLTRRHVTVALTGDAGDELFGGYNRYLMAARVQQLTARWPEWSRHAAGKLLATLPSNTVDTFGAFARRCGMSRVPPVLGEKVSRISQFLAARNDMDAYLGTLSQWIGAAPLTASAPAAALEDLAGVPLAQRMMCWDMDCYLPDDILVKVDRAAMSASLETRVPMLDHRIVEFALRIPMHSKIRGKDTKWMLRQLLERYLPLSRFDQPKQGFSVPLDAWLRGPLRDWAEPLLSENTLYSEGLLDRSAVLKIWNEHLSGHRNHQRALWTVLMLQAWLVKLKIG